MPDAVALSDPEISAEPLAVAVATELSLGTVLPDKTIDEVAEAVPVASGEPELVSVTDPVSVYADAVAVGELNCSVAVGAELPVALPVAAAEAVARSVPEAVSVDAPDCVLVWAVPDGDAVAEVLSVKLCEPVATPL